LKSQYVDHVAGTRHASGYVRDAGGTAAARGNDGRSSSGRLHVHPGPAAPAAPAALPTGTPTPATGRSGQILVDCM